MPEPRTRADDPFAAPAADQREPTDETRPWRGVAAAIVVGMGATWISIDPHLSVLGVLAGSAWLAYLLWQGTPGAWWAGVCTGVVIAGLLCGRIAVGATTPAVALALIVDLRSLLILQAVLLFGLLLSPPGRRAFVHVPGDDVPDLDD